MSRFQQFSRGLTSLKFWAQLAFRPFLTGIYIAVRSLQVSLSKISAFRRNRPISALTADIAATHAF